MAHRMQIAILGMAINHGIKWTTHDDSVFRQSHALVTHQISSIPACFSHHLRPCQVAVECLINEKLCCLRINSAVSGSSLEGRLASTFITTWDWHVPLNVLTSHLSTWSWKTCTAYIEGCLFSRKVIVVHCVLRLSSLFLVSLRIPHRNRLFMSHQSHQHQGEQRMKLQPLEGAKGSWPKAGCAGRTQPSRLQNAMGFWNSQRFQGASWLPGWIRMQRVLVYTSTHHYYYHQNYSIIMYYINYMYIYIQLYIYTLCIYI